jgi:hypothetical protein
MAMAGSPGSRCMAKNTMETINHSVGIIQRILLMIYLNKYCSYIFYKGK